MQRKYLDRGGQMKIEDLLPEKGLLESFAVVDDPLISA